MLALLLDLSHNEHRELTRWGNMAFFLWKGWQRIHVAFLEFDSGVKLLVAASGLLGMLPISLLKR